jgi:uncharacterized repeat protein (TIGR01451 family)
MARYGAFQKKEALMVLKRVGWVFVLILACSLPLQSAVAGENVLTGTVEAFRIIEDSDGNTAFVSAEKAHPKDVIEYRLTYRNTGDVPLANVAIIDPVPVGMQYIPTSATDKQENAVEFSIDQGETYHRWPVIRTVRTPDGTSVKREATPDMITHIRWVVAATLNPAHEITVSYRAFVE